jgi:hypothetical protein
MILPEISQQPIPRQSIPRQAVPGTTTVNVELNFN